LHIVVNVVKLANPGEPGFEHLEECLSRERLQVFGREASDELIHELAPGPEAVGLAHVLARVLARALARGPARVDAPALGEPRHAALESMAVNIWHAREAHLRPLIARQRGRAALDYGNSPAGRLNPHSLRPSAGQQCSAKPEPGLA